MDGKKKPSGYYYKKVYSRGGGGGGGGMLGGVRSALIMYNVINVLEMVVIQSCCF